MANYQLLKADIDEKVYQNGHQEITGENLNFVLNAMVTTLGAEYQFAGVATIATNPGTPDAKVFYIANGKGTYTKFGSLEVTEDEVVVLYYDTEWHKVATGIASQAKLTELEGKMGELNKNVNTIDAKVNGKEHLIYNFEQIPSRREFFIDVDTWRNYANYEGSLIEVEQGDVYRLVASGTNVYYAFVKEQEITSGEKVLFSGGITRTLSINANSEAKFTIPKDTKWLYILRMDAGTDLTPQLVERLPQESNLANKADVDEIKTMLNGKVYTTFSASKETYIDGTIWDVINSNYQGAIIKIKGGTKIDVKTKDVNTQIAFLKEQEIIAKQAVIFASGYTKKVDISANTEMSFVSPNDAVYLYVMCRYDGNDRTPEYIKVHSVLSQEEVNIVSLNRSKESIVKCLGQADAKEYSEGSAKPMCFIHLSDTHTRPADYKRVKNMVEYMNAYNNIQFALLTGDIVYDTFADAMTSYDEAISGAKKNIYNVIGNHDAGQYNPSIGLASVGTDAQVYQKYIAPYIDGWNLKTDGSGTPHPSGKSYYFTDFTQEKVRMIVLCEFESDCELDASDATRYKYSREYRAVRQEQVNWLISTLQTTPSGYGVIVALHQCAGELSDIDDNEFVTPYLLTRNVYHSYASRNWLLDILEAFRTKGAVNFSFEQTGAVVATINVSADFSAKNDTELICTICGHTHNDYIGHYRDYPNIVVLNVGADNLTYTSKCCPRKEGDVTEDLFNVINIDRNLRKITIVRIGSDQSLLGQDRSRMSIKYY